MSRSRSPGLDGGDHRPDRDSPIFRGQDFRQYAGGRRRDFRIDLVRADLQQCFILADGVADLFEPPDDRSFGDALPHLGHDDFDTGHVSVLAVEKARNVST